MGSQRKPYCRKLMRLEHSGDKMTDIVFISHYQSPLGGITLASNGDALTGDNLPEWQITVYAKDFTVPATVKGGVIYHIFADRFAPAGERVEPRYGVLKNPAIHGVIQAL